MSKFRTMLLSLIVDQANHKSFYAVLIICVVFVFMLRGCYKGDYMVNGQHVDALKIAWTASIAAFHVVAAGALIIAMMLSVGGVRRDRENGTLAYMLSRPVARYQYILAKIMGTWFISFAFMFILHATIVIVTWFNTKAVIPGYLTASLLCSVNVLFMVGLVTLLSILLADVTAVLAAVGVAAVSFVSDSIFQAIHSAIVQSAVPAATSSATDAWRIAWPKLMSLQYMASSFIDTGDFHSMGPIPPYVNVVFYSAILVGLCVWRFNKEEI
jgi:ABC-type transport system involved in multi-copper enzyme maturation permease subunit